MEKFLKQTFEVLIKTFWRKWKGQTLPKWTFIFKQLEKCQNEYYPGNLNLISFCIRTSLPVLIFPISLLKRNHIETNFWRKFCHFPWRQKYRVFFINTNLFLIFDSKEIFFQEYIEMELLFLLLLNIFHNIRRYFRMAKLKHSNSNI